MIFSLSVDLDGLGCYAAIHGVAPGALDDAALRAVPETAVQRLAEAFGDVPATWFVIGREAGIAPDALRELAGRHELASHSHEHDYALSRRPAAEIAADLERAEEAIFAASGVTPRGFRAPGYTLSSALVAALRDRGYAYDSSLLPSPPYYAAKAAAIAAYALRGRRSQSILGAPLQLFGPRAAHRREGVRELPIATLPLLRAPVIGTVVTSLEAPLAARLARRAEASGHFNLELHGIDALDASDVPRALHAQPGLRVPAAVKLRRLRELVAALRARGEPRTLLAAAQELLP